MASHEQPAVRGDVRHRLNEPGFVLYVLSEGVGISGGACMTRQRHSHNPERTFRRLVQPFQKRRIAAYVPWVACIAVWKEDDDGG